MIHSGAVSRPTICPELVIEPSIRHSSSGAIDLEEYLSTIPSFCQGSHNVSNLFRCLTVGFFRSYGHYFMFGSIKLPVYTELILKCTMKVLLPFCLQSNAPEFA